LIAAGVVAIVVIVVALNSFYIVGQAEQALVLRFGNPIRIALTPGLRLKAPFVDTVVVLDKRIMPLDLPEQEVIVSDQKRLVVDAFARYRIADPLRFYQSVGTLAAADNRLITFLNSSLRNVLGDASFLDVVRDKRQALMERIRDLVNRQAGTLGVEVVDVRIRRADLPEANSQAIYRRMQTERQREAAELRAEGNEAAQRIRADADRRATVIVADATRDAERVRGEGDATRNGIYAAAYGKDPDFFAFYRSMQAYEAALKPSNTRFLLSPDSPFFRYFGNLSPKRPPPTAASAEDAAGAPAGAGGGAR
jgi:membrane protease subunit HflC